jgi:alpha-ribazole phosphatase
VLRHPRLSLVVMLYVVRHARPLVEPGVCYGATDVPADEPATHTAAMALAQALPPGVRVQFSPMLRCVQLAKGLQHLRPELLYHSDARLVEMNFGQWEGQRWDAINKAEIDAWTNNFGDWRCGGAENVSEVMARVAAAWDACVADPTGQPTAWITHAGVIRAVCLIAGGQRAINRADQWPVDAPAWGEFWQLTATAQRS